jgi:anthranilate synthase/aminodeoxychorismate synthase-like glutamine amidotransferase
MILLLDNYDSFTYNLAQYLAQLGARVEVRRNDQITCGDIEQMRPERIVISPGPGRPEDAGITVELIRRFAGRVPILGVCLGHQAIGYAFGGRIVRAPEILHGKTSEVRHDGLTVFRGLPNPFPATRYHSLVVERRSLPRELEVSAETRGRGGKTGVIMGLRLRRRGASRKGASPLEGVQFHPESVLTDAGLTLLRNFLEL